MPDEELLLYVRRASRTQVATSSVVAAMLFAAFLAALPFAHMPLPQYNAFVPVVDTVLFIGDGVTAAILFSQAAILRSRALMALATGYLFSGLIIVPHALSFPGAFGPAGLIGGGFNTTIWLYVFWHCGLPCAVIAYAFLPKSQEGRTGTMRATMAWWIAGAVLAVLLLSVLATAGHDWLPTLMTNPIDWLPGNAFTIAGVAVLILVAMAAVWRGRWSLLDLWLMVALWAWLLEALMSLTVSSRYSLGWYSGRFAAMLSGIFVLLALLVEISRLYLQLALSAVSEQQRREGQLLSLDAAASSIAHEVKQPITAMVTNASAALVRMQHDQPDLARVKGSLERIVEDGHRAADVIGSIRALFGRREVDEDLVDLNQLIRETLDSRAVEIAGRAIVTTQDLTPDLPVLRLQRLQMRQVFVNLLNNAIEALGERPAGPRRIVISSRATEGGGAAIEIGDSGRGIAADQTERIFDAFFTTKTYGTGMGLPLCRSIVEGHGGKLGVSSTVGQGTTFHIVLPGPDL